MRIIEINVNKQIQEIISENDVNSMSNLIENSANYIKLHFTFDEDWNGFNTKYVIFKHKSNKVKSLIDEDGYCVVPYSVIRVPNFSFSVLSENDTQRLTTNILYIEVGKTISVDSVQEEKELELLYKQLETLVTLENNEIEELKEMINNIGDNISVDVDLSEINAKLDNIIQMTSQLMGTVSTISNIDRNVSSIGNLVGTMNDKLGDENSGIVHDTKWSLTRIEETKSNTNTIISLLTDANVIADEILETLEG